MGCGCDKKDKGKHNKQDCMTPPVIEITNPQRLVTFHKVLIPVSQGDESTFPPVNGLYKNVLMVYESNGHAYLYSSDGVPSYISFDSGGIITVSSLPPTSQAATCFLYVTSNGTMAMTFDNESWTVFAQGGEGGSFDVLSGRPKYGGAEMTSATNIPRVEDETVARLAAEAALQNGITELDAAIDTDAITNLAVDPGTSTTAVQLNATNKNLKTGIATMTSIALPVASEVQAGVMNKATYDAISANSSSIAALTNGAIALTGLSPSITQADLTAAWRVETGITDLINRASIYDVTNDKVWTYYSNTQTWYATTNTAQVVINTFTNSSEGTIKGSTVAGQVFAENDGTGSINGWDALTGQVTSNTSKLGTIAQGAQVNVQSDWGQTDTTADDYIKNKPTIPVVPTVNDAILTVQENGVTVGTFSANASSNATVNLTSPTITVTNVDPGEGSPLAENNFIAVYE